MIKASEALASFSAELEGQYDRAEHHIDAAILGMSGDDVRVDLASLGDISPRVLRRLEQAYRDGGWTWEFRRGDQRDPGPFVTLRVSSPPRSGPGGA